MNQPSGPSPSGPEFTIPTLSEVPVKTDSSTPAAAEVPPGQQRGSLTTITGAVKRPDQ